MQNNLFKKKRVAKAAYRKRKREEMEASISQSPSTSTTESPQCSTTESSHPPTFSQPPCNIRNWHRSAKPRSLRKAIRALSRSPRKKEIIKSLASTFNLRIQLKKNGQPKNELSEEEPICLEQFFQRPDMTYIALGKNQRKYLGKVNGESQYAQIRYLLWNLNDLV